CHGWRVGHDAHDRQPWCPHARRADSAPDGILAWEVRLGERLVYDDVGFASVDVVAAEAASSQQRHAHDVGVSAGDGAECDDGDGPGEVFRFSIHEQPVAETDERQWQTGGRRGAAHAGYLRHALEDSAMHVHGSLAIWIRGGWETDAERQRGGE